jgi:prepilin-type N-terminal cleavage/methylation domain-containing protein/prepilin-type processing-associated H-X9-DG protein
MRRRAFTLIELLVVIAIIAILAAILFPVFAQARDKARAASCISNLKQVGTSLLMYTQDYDESFPASRHATGCPGNDGGTRHSPWSVTIFPYVKNVGVFSCPSDPSNVRNAAPGFWCTGALQRAGRDNHRRSMVPVAQPEGTCGPAPGGVMSTGWGANQAELTGPASTIMVCERFEGGTSLCHEGSCHYKGSGDFVNGGYLPSAQTGLSVQIVAPEAILRGFFGGGTDFTSKYHQSSFNVIYADGHVKAVRWSQTFQRNAGGQVMWSQWDKRLPQ